jgi:hypothetical protein
MWLRERPAFELDSVARHRASIRTANCSALRPAPSAEFAAQPGLGHSTAARDQRFRCGLLSLCPNEMVPLQIDLAIGVGRLLFGRSANQELG